jgi:hypothetical protein
VAASAANAVVLIAEVNSMAAAAAMAALDILLICIFDSSIVIERSGIAAHIKDPANALIITQLSKLMSVSMRLRRVPTAAKQSLLNDGFLMFGWVHPITPPTRTPSYADGAFGLWARNSGGAAGLSPGPL